MANLLTTSFPTRFGRKHCLHILIIWLGLRTQQKKQQRNIGTVSRIEYDRITAYVQTWRSLRKQPTFPKKPLVSLQSNKIFHTDIPYCWRVTTQIWVVLLIGWSKISTTLKHYPDLGRDTSSASSFCSCFSDISISFVLWDYETKTVIDNQPRLNQNFILNQMWPTQCAHCM